MPVRSSKRGVSLVEVLVLLAIIGILLLILFPAVQTTREAARRALCLNKMKQLGQGLHSRHDRHKRFPPSCYAEKTVRGRIKADTLGWSWIADILPELEQQALWSTLSIHEGRPDVEPGHARRGQTPHADARATPLSAIICPSYHGDRYHDVRRTDAVTNYKVMGATHIESLNDDLEPGGTKPRYGLDNGPEHPDGAMFYASELDLAAFADQGTANTILAAETIEPVWSRWAFGEDATLVGLPPTARDGRTDLVFSPVAGSAYYGPKGFTRGRFGRDSTVAQECRTYLDWDYEKLPYEDGLHDNPPITFGPSSDHPGVVNHLFVDGSVHTLSNGIDVALYMFLITRNGSDPAWEFRP